MSKGMFTRKEPKEQSRKARGINVGDLRKAIADLADDAEVLLSVQGGREDLFKTIDTGTPKRSNIQVLWGWKYQTREVNNAYGCNDDRYGGSVFLIEVGEESP